jgi:putative FmdB family regulatory protein
VPLYEYECPQGHVTEILAGVDSVIRVQCKCGRISKRIISAPARPVMGGMIYQPIPGDPRPRAEHKVDFKDWKRQDDAHKQRMLKNAGKASVNK